MNRTEPWSDVDAITSKLDSLWANPIPRLSDEAKADYLKQYAEKNPASKLLYEDARRMIPGAVQHNLSINYPFPVAMDNALGAYMWDIDGNRYTDFLQAGGPTMIGSNDPGVREKLFSVIRDHGAATGLLSKYELLLIGLIQKHMPHIEMFRMFASGTEADMAAIKLARGYTEKKKIIKICDAYHGWSDQLLYDIQAAGTKGASAEGVPEEAYRHTQAVPVNDTAALESLLTANEAEGGTACVILEPLGPESGARPAKYEYTHEVRRLCDQHGTLLVFDEVVTAFRVDLGGGAKVCGVTPDITVFGKAVTGGYPASGGVGGPAKIMQHFSPAEGAPYKRVHVGGTLTASALSCAAGYYTILEEERTHACEKAAEAGERLCTGINRILEKFALPFVCYHQYSIVHLDVVGKFNLTITDQNRAEVQQKLAVRNRLLNEFGLALMCEGIASLLGRRFYTTVLDTPDIVDDALARFDRVFSHYVWD